MKTRRRFEPHDSASFFPAIRFIFFEHEGREDREEKIHSSGLVFFEGSLRVGRADSGLRANPPHIRRRVRLGVSSGARERAQKSPQRRNLCGP